MGRKEEVDAERESPRKEFLLHGGEGMEEEVKSYLLPNETVVYQAEDMFFTNKRIIKHKHDWFARTFHYFYTTFEDLDLRYLEGIKAKNVINLKLLFWGAVIMLLGPVSLFLTAIPGLGGFGEFIETYLVEGLGLGGLLLIGLILVGSALILRDRVVEFEGHGTRIRSRHFHDDELLKIRELQHIRLRRLGLDK
ncbi:hypothetical protein KY327_01330 [Candidatus Woesearchaeota archaeon]|nr:hypothetical protein [Candidatus Woesearchaeota archaeon]